MEVIDMKMKIYTDEKIWCAAEKLIKDTGVETKAVLGAIYLSGKLHGLVLVGIGLTLAGVGFVCVRHIVNRKKKKEGS